MINLATVQHALMVLYGYLPELMQGAFISLQITFCSVLLGFTGGTLLGLMLLYGNRWVRAGAQLYVVVIRGTPMLVQMVALFAILPFVGIMIPAFWSAVLAIGINSAAYVSQIIRAGVQAVGTGQQEAAQTLGFSAWQTVRYIMLPQAFRIVLPALGNEIITLIKDSSLASVIGVAELTHQGSFMMSRTYDALTTYAAVGIIYLTLTTCATLCLHALERKIYHVNY